MIEGRNCWTSGTRFTYIHIMDHSETHSLLLPHLTWLCCALYLQEIMLPRRLSAGFQVRWWRKSRGQERWSHGISLHLTQLVLPQPRQGLCLCHGSNSHNPLVVPALTRQPPPCCHFLWATPASRLRGPHLFIALSGNRFLLFGVSFIISVVNFLY